MTLRKTTIDNSGKYKIISHKVNKLILFYQIERVKEKERERESKPNTIKNNSNPRKQKTTFSKQ